MMQGNFIFHEVGHGLFYTGEIMDDNGETLINFVYDIGSYNGKDFIKPIVNQYLDANNIGVIDILFLSHLDRDHINGLEFLVKNTNVKIKSVIMPYLAIREWEFYRNTLNEMCGDIFLDDFYKDPYSCFGKECNVYLFSSSDKPYVEDEDKYREKYEVRSEFEKALLRSGFQIHRSDIYSNVSQLIPYKGNTITYNYWCFSLYQPGHTEKYKEKLVNDIRNLLAESATSTQNNCVSQNNIGNLTLDVIRKIKSRIENIDSIIVEHYPEQLGRSGNNTLLTGDASSAKLYSKGKGLLSNINNYLLVQVPHHGSRITSKKYTVKSKIDKSVICHNENGMFKVNTNTRNDYKNVSGEIKDVTEVSGTFFVYDVPNISSTKGAVDVFSG